MIKVAITDDHLIVIEGLKNTLCSHAHIMITGTYRSADDVLIGLKQEVPDVLLIDVQFPDKSGKELVPLLLMQYPGLRILILSGIQSSSHIKEMMHKGCKGYLLKSTTDQNTLLNAIHVVYAGELFLPAGLKEQLLSDMLSAKRKINHLHANLTRREKEILHLIAAEYHNQQIADHLFISLRTVETHRYNLMQKLNIKTTAGLVKEAMHYNHL